VNRTGDPDRVVAGELAVEPGRLPLALEQAAACGRSGALRPTANHLTRYDPEATATPSGFRRASALALRPAVIASVAHPATPRGTWRSWYIPK
jgi:hypothetical protein